MIKRFIQFLFAMLFCLPAFGQATGLADLKFGRAQIADSQWNVGACMYTATCQIYSKNPGTVYKIPWTTGQLTWATGDYVAFVPTGNATNPFNAIQYAANGTQKAVLGTGRIINMGTDYFFFVGNDNNTGQLFSMTQGFANTSGVTWTGTVNPTVAQVNTYAQGGSTTPLAAGQTVTPTAPVVTVTGTAVTYTTRNVVSGNTTTVYRTPVTTTTYSDGTTTNANGTETVYQTRVASNVVTNKITNGVLTVYTTPINTVTDANGNKTIEANGAVITTTQNVQTGLTYRVYDFDAYTYTCSIFGCAKNLFGPYRVPNLSPGAYNQVATGVTTGGIYVPTNGSFPAMGDGTLVHYKGTITAPVTVARPAGTVYRLYFYSNSDDGFVLNVNGGTIINDQSTNQWQSIGGYTASGWIDVVAGQTYNLEAWYWNDLGGYGMRFQWNYGAGRMSIPNSAFTTGWITESTVIDTTGIAYSNSAVVNTSGTSVALGPTVEGGTITITNSTGQEIITSGSNSSAGLGTDQQTRVDTWQNKTLNTGNSVNLDVNGNNNTLDIEQVGSKNLVSGIGQSAAVVQGSYNSVTVNQGTAGAGQNEINLRVIGNQNTLNIGQARDNLGAEIGTNGHYQAVDVNGYQNTLTTQQSNATLGGHYQETTINGNQNNVTKRQTDNGNKIMFTTITGDNNTVDAVQKGTGQHQLTTNLTGNNNSALVVQEGSQQNKANIDLTNAGGPATLDLQQSGGKNFTIIQSCTNPAGCSITVRQ